MPVKSGSPFLEPSALAGDDAPALARLAPEAERVGLLVRGAFHPLADEGVPDMAPGRPAATLVLLGWSGRFGYDIFAASPEATDDRPDPLDRWSRRIVDGLARQFGGVPLYPFGGPPYHPFQRWAARAEPVSSSPLGLLIHPRFGLWHSYRGAIAFAVHLESEPHRGEPSPCSVCVDRPCLSACPVGAFTTSGYDVERCAAHLKSPRGRPCRERGCLARLACPVAPGEAYGERQAAFHMAAFNAARP